MARQGIYCIENWSGRRANRNSVRPMLEFLESSGVARCIYERVSTLGQLEDAIDDWALAQAAPALLPRASWIARHDLRRSTRDEARRSAADRSRGQRAGRQSQGQGPVLGLMLDPYGGPPQTARGGQGHETEHALRLRGLRRGFEAAAFDLLALSALCGYDQASSAVKYLRREHGGFVRRMRFRSEPNWDELRELPYPRSSVPRAARLSVQAHAEARCPVATVLVVAQSGTLSPAVGACSAHNGLTATGGG